jgi:mRNA-degrading endonuclease YafQ of YafQ-DinJ toxin-antitoxin module
MPHRPSQFQLTIIKPYYKDNSFKLLQNVLKDILEDVLENVLEDILEDILEENHNQHALEGDYNSNIIVVDVPQL